MPRLNERHLFELWRSRQSLKTKIARANKKVVQMDEAIIAEMERRGLKMLQDGETGEHVTLVTPETVVYDQEALKTRLRRSAGGRKILERCTKEILDMRSISSEIQAGNITADVIAQCSSIKPSASYLRGGQNG